MTLTTDKSIWALFRHDVRKWFFIAWHRFVGTAFNFLGILELFLRTLFIVYPIYITIRTGYSWYYLALYLLLVIFVKKRDLSPENIQFVRDGYADRKAWMTGAIMLLDQANRESRKLTENEIKEVRQLSLDSIVSYVRGHRSDVKRTKIFANILVEHGEGLKVIQRDSSCRRDDPKTHPKEAMLVWRAISERRVAVSGDIRRDYPNTAAGKVYESVLIFPVSVTKADSRQIVAAVSIDSSEPFHFDTYENDLHSYLMPYLELIGSTFK